MSFIAKRFFATSAAKIACCKKIVAKTALVAPVAVAVLIPPPSAVFGVIAKKHAPKKSATSKAPKAPKTHWEAMSVREKNDFLNF